MESIVSKFQPTASLPEHGLVMLFDLEGFSKFFSQPDVQNYVPKFLNYVIEAVNICIKGGFAYWIDDDSNDLTKNPYPLPDPIHSKFLGDGVLYIWRYNDFEHNNIVDLVNRLYNLKLHFKKVVDRAIQEVPIMDIPRKIRFGLSAGTVFKLEYETSSEEEYIGYSINLASRLQGYCSEIGLICSARLNIKSDDLRDFNYTKLSAIKIKGFPQEIVFVDSSDYEDLTEDRKRDLFVEIESS